MDSTRILLCAIVVTLGAASCGGTVDRQATGTVSRAAMIERAIKRDDAPVSAVHCHHVGSMSYQLGLEGPRVQRRVYECTERLAGAARDRDGCFVSVKAGAYREADYSDLRKIPRMASLKCLSPRAHAADTQPATTQRCLHAVRGFRICYQVDSAGFFDSGAIFSHQRGRWVKVIGKPSVVA